MSAANHMPSIRRVVFVGESIAGTGATLALLRRVAEQARFELAGLFVEDAVLLRAAALPATREVGRVSGAVRTFDVPSVERMLRAQAEQLRGELAAMAEELRLPWTFTVARGRVSEQALERSAEADITILPGRVRRRAGRREDEGNALRGAAITALIDTTEAGARALSAAWLLAGHEIERLALAVPTSESPDEMRTRLAQRLGVPPERLNLYSFAGALGELPGQIRRSRPAALVLPTAWVAGAEEELADLLAALDAVLILVS